MFLWGEVDALWCEGVVEWLRRRRTRRAETRVAARTLADIEAFLGAQPGG